MSEENRYLMTIGIAVVAAILIWILWQVSKGPRNRGK